MEVAACVHFLSNGNHRARGVLDNREDVVFRRIVLRSHTPVREQTDMGVYWYVWRMVESKLRKGFAAIFLMYRSIRKSVSVFKVLVALGWDRRFQRHHECQILPCSQMQSLKANSLEHVPNQGTRECTHVVACVCLAPAPPCPKNLKTFLA